ncbi:MAG TPA: hypothetical protein IAA63_09650 [Candidatus Pullilachnospira stercoravium]|uniref:Uncharacterized protein n=1 Tax=Candidatus Pullilachnospira stercoravium TaxID=2840913 RepID=A0A9D1NVM8_9FIRM|nr:hypothetical protein [Candidatus Pullilachnospira stercoravium]
MELEILSAENLSESQEIAATEIMAGDGADIYIRPSALFEDTYKIQEAGMFEDLMPWLRTTIYPQPLICMKIQRPVISFP